MGKHLAYLRRFKLATGRGVVGHLELCYSWMGLVADQYLGQNKDGDHVRASWEALPTLC